MTQLSMPPLSWLTLERYVLDELAPSERARVERQLAQSGADRACLDEILSDLSELPPLPAPAPAQVTSIESAVFGSSEDVRRNSVTSQSSGWASSTEVRSTRSASPSASRR